MNSAGILLKQQLFAQPHAAMQSAKTVVVPVPAEAVGGKASDPVLYADTGKARLGHKPVEAAVTHYPGADERPVARVMVSKASDGGLQLVNEHGDSFRTVAMPLVPVVQEQRQGWDAFFAKIWDIMTGNINR